MEVEKIFKLAATELASDVHLLVGKPPLLRINGDLIEVELPPYTNMQVKEALYSLLTPEQKRMYEEQKELEFSYEFPGIARFRINLHFEKKNYGLVARRIDYHAPRLKDLNIPEVIYKLTRLHQGLVLVTRPTPSRKSTTLAGMIEEINVTRKAHIITLEDPIEFVYTSKKSIIRQRQLGDDMLSFAEGLRHVLRQDPDIILVGEMRDLESIALALTLAETGHLVFGTLHTQSAGKTVDRIIDVFPPHQQSQARVQLSMTLSAVIAQRLIKTVDGKRTAAREIMVGTPAIANMIRESKVSQIDSVIQTSSGEGMIFMDQHLVELYKQGIISKDEAASWIAGTDYLKKLEKDYDRLSPESKQK